MKQHKFFKYTFNYEKTQTDIPGPSHFDLAKAGMQALKDWNRSFNIYYINGQLLGELRENKPFENMEDLRDFVKAHLTHEVDIESHEKLTDLAIMHFHQGGIPHAIANRVFHLLLKSHEGDKDKIHLSGRNEAKICFEATKEGVIVRENTTYGGVMIEKKNGELEFETTPKDYVLKFSGEALLTTDKVVLNKLDMDCPHRQLSDYVEQKGILSKTISYITDFFRSITNLIRSSDNTTENNKSKDEDQSNSISL